MHPKFEPKFKLSFPLNSSTSYANSPARACQTSKNLNFRVKFNLQHPSPTHLSTMLTLHWGGMLKNVKLHKNISTRHLMSFSRAPWLPDPIARPSCYFWQETSSETQCK